MAEIASNNVTSQVMTTLGAGSGLDITKLAEDLTAVEKEPKQAKIEAGVTATEAKISAYGLISYQLGLLQTAFESLNDADEIAQPSGVSSNTAVTFSNLDGTAETGVHFVTVSQLAQGQRVKSNEFSSSTSALNGGAAFNLSLTIGSGSPTAIAVTTDTPAGVVSAINAAKTGVKATLIDTGVAGANYRIVLSGSEGSDNSFTLTSTPDLGFANVGNTVQSALDAHLTFDGLAVTRSSNEIADLISGTTLSLNSTTSADVRVAVNSDKSTLKAGIENIVAMYNDFNGLMTELTSSLVNEDVELSGALQRDLSTARYILNTVRTALIGDSSTASGSVSSLRDLGVSLDKTGNFVLNDAKYIAAVENNYDDVVMMLTANTTNQSLFDSSSKGLSQDIATLLDGLTAKNGIISTRIVNAESSLEGQKEELLVLEKRMEAVYQRYLTQFAAMETMMEKLNGMQDYLTGQFESLAKAYDK